MGLRDFIRELFGGQGAGVRRTERPGDRQRESRPEPPGLGPEELSRRLGAGLAELLAIKPQYGTFEVPKRSGGRRTIHAPAPQLKALQRRILRRLLGRLAVHPAAVGFERKQSIVTHARRHAGAAVVLRMDIRDFFPSTTRSRVGEYLRAIGWGREARDMLLGWLTWRDALPQGAPTSPRLSNLTNYAMDARLSGQAAACGATYTRYADDLTFSFAADSRQAVRKVIGGTKKIVGDYGYRLHQKRKLVIRRRHQRQMVTGLVVNARPALPRQTRRRLRAIRHHLAAGRAATLTAEQLAGWNALETMILRQRVAPAADGGSGKQTRPDLAR